MIPPSETHPDPRTLTPQERELARRLAQVGPRGEPSSALDARILAAAHDAVSEAPVGRAQQRWPVALGVAASLALAIGVAWQLRPLPDTSAAYQSEAPSRAVVETPADVGGTIAAESAAAPAESAAAAQSDVAITATPAPLPPPPPAAAASGSTRPAARMATVPAQPSRAADATPAQPEIVFDTAAPTPASASMAAKAAANAPAQAPVAVERQTAAAAADAAATALPETDTLDRLQSSGTREATSGDEPGTEVPPATMASPEARDAWLARIRELVIAGKTETARASLREFTHRYPDYPLPADLRALGQ